MGEVTEKSWRSRLRGVLSGLLLGFILIFGAIFLIFWNENFSLHLGPSLIEVRKTLISIPTTPINSKNNGRVVYLTGLASTHEKLQDPLLGLNLVAIGLIRKVEMYQWQEEPPLKNEKLYTYKKIWSEALIDSAKFKDQDYQNPPSKPIECNHTLAQNVTVGDFNLPSELIKKIKVETPIDLSKINLESLKTYFTRPVYLINNHIYIGEDSRKPEVGDLKISASSILPQTVSIIAEQTGHTFKPYRSATGESIFLLTSGQETSDGMIRAAHDENLSRTLLIRLGSLFMMIIGFALLMRSSNIFANKIPVIRSFVEFGSGLMSVLLGFCLWTVFLAIAWLTTRPFFAIGLLAIVILVLYLTLKSYAQFKKE